MISFNLRAVCGEAFRQGAARAAVGLTLCAVTLTALAGCGGGKGNSGRPDTSEENIGGIFVPNPNSVMQSPRLTVSGTRGTVTMMVTPNYTPAGYEDYNYIVVGPNTNTTAAYPSTYTLWTPPIWADRKFKEWQVNGQTIDTTDTIALSQVPATASGGTLTAVYEPYTPPTGEKFVPNFNQDSNYRFGTLSFKIFIDPNLAPNPGAKELFYKGLNKWVDATGGVVNFTEVYNQSQANIRFLSADNLVGVGDGVLGVAVDIPLIDSLNNDLDYSTIWLIRSMYGVTTPADRELYSAVVAHELGHAMGIVGDENSGHSPNPWNLMYFAAGTNEVTDADVNTLANIYPSLFPGSGIAVTPSPSPSP